MPLKNASGSQRSEQIECQKLSLTDNLLTNASILSNQVCGPSSKRGLLAAAAAAKGVGSSRTRGAGMLDTAFISISSIDAGTSKGLAPFQARQRRPGANTDIRLRAVLVIRERRSLRLHTTLVNHRNTMGMSNWLDRREILKWGSSALAVAALAPISPAEDAPAKPVDAPAAKKRTLKKAVMYGMIGPGKTVMEKFEALKEAGFDGVEMDSPTSLSVDEIKAAGEKTGILIEGEVDSAHWSATLSHNNPKLRAQGLGALQTALRDCKALGGTSVLLVPGVVDKSVSYDACWKRSQEEIRKVIPLARELGVKIAIENVWNHFIMSPLEAARYVDEFEAPDAIGWHLDLGNLIVYGWPEQWIRILGKRIVKLHIKEFSRARANNEGLWKGFGVELMEGDNDWPAIMKALDEVGYNAWACAEVNGGDLARLKFISQRMDKILGLP